MILYTSGTTGRPKGARITYGMALFNAVHATSSVALGVDSTNLVFLPTFHAAGLHLYANPIFQLGATNVVLRTFDPGRFLVLLASKSIRITATFQRADGRTLHVRKAIRAEPPQQAIYDALGIGSAPGGTRKMGV